MIDKRDRSLSISIARAVRAQRGDDVRAERCLRVGRDWAALWGVLGVHVVDFTWFSPNRETSRPRLKDILGYNSATQPPCAILGYPRRCYSPGASPQTPRRAHRCSTVPIPVLLLPPRCQQPAHDLQPFRHGRRVCFPRPRRARRAPATVWWVPGGAVGHARLSRRAFSADPTKWPK